MTSAKTCELCGAAWTVFHAGSQACLETQLITYRAEASRQHTALSHISGALVDSGVVVPADELGYGEAVRCLTAKLRTSQDIWLTIHGGRSAVCRGGSNFLTVTFHRPAVTCARCLKIITLIDATAADDEKRAGAKETKT